MKNLHPDLEALMPEPVAWQIAVMRAEEDGMTIVGWRDEFAKASFNYSSLPKREMFTADQVRAAILGATERAAKVCDSMSDSDYSPTQCAAAIRGAGASTGRGEGGEGA